MTRNIFDIFDAILGQKSPLLSALTPSEYRPFWRLYNYEEGKPDNPAGKKSIDFDEEMAERLIRIVKRKKEGYYKDIERGLASATISRLYNNLFEAFSDWFTLNFSPIFRTEYNVIPTAIYCCFSCSVLVHG